MEHEGKPLAADETDSQHHRDPRVASVHVRAAVTWLAVFPMVAIGMTVIAEIAPTWPAVLKALILTLVVVPTAVYVLVPRFLLLYTRLRAR
jgi:antibiotic biosynthesis monooxygenase (ABM) superfamily enzyme